MPDPFIFDDEKAPAAPGGFVFDDEKPAGSRVPVYRGKAPRFAKGLSDAVQAGLQGSATGLIGRGKLPDIVLDPHHSTWAQRLTSSAAGLVSEIPEMVAGAFVGGAAGGAAGTAVPVIGNVVGAAVGGGAGAFAAPTLVRESLMQYYQSQQGGSTLDFLDRVGIVLKATGKDALVGGATAGVGAAAGKLATNAITKGAATAMTRGEARIVAAASGLGEYGTMVVAPAALQGRLPEAEDFANAAILIGGMKVAGAAATKLNAARIEAKLQKIYEKTGKTPAEVYKDSLIEPKIMEELKAETPKVAEGEPAPTGLPKVYEELSYKQAAVDSFPGSKIQAVIDNPFGADQIVKQTHEIHMRYQTGPESLQQLTMRMSEVFKEEFDAKAGTVPWAETEAKANALASATGVSRTELVEGLKAHFGPEIPLDVQVHVKGAQIAGAINDAGAALKILQEAGPNATAQMKADAARALTILQLVQGETIGAKAEVGRALNYMKKTNDLLNQSSEMVQLWEGSKGNIDTVLRMAMDMKTPDALAKFSRGLNKATNWQKIMEVYKAGLVSGPFTQIANIIGNTTFTAMRPVVDLVGATIGAMTGAENRVSFSEPLARIMGNIEGAKDSLKLVRETFLNDAPTTKGDLHMIANEGKFGYAVRTPFRMLSAMDVLARTSAERGEAYALASRKAVKEGFNPGTHEFNTAVAQTVENMPNNMAKAVEEAGARFTFQAPLGEHGKSVSKFVKTNHLEWAVPFVMTPINIFKEMIRLTPAAPFLQEYRAAFAKGMKTPEAQKAIAEMTLGVGLSTAATSLALSGHLSGSGDPDPAKRRIQVAAGWQPYSVKIDGKWYSYQRVQPIGTLLGMAADMAEVWQHLEAGESDRLPKMVGTAFANSVTNQTFLQGFTNLVNAISDPQRFAPAYAQSLAGSLVPALVSQTAGLLDPYAREVSSVREAVINRIPGVRQELMPKRDPFGEKIESPDRVGFVSPVTTKDVSTDKVRLEAARLGVGAAKAPKDIELGSEGLGVGKVVLTPEQRDIFGEEAGKMAHQQLTRMVNSPGWDKMPEAFQRIAFKNVFEISNGYGKYKALTDEERRAAIAKMQQEINVKLGRPSGL